MDPAYKARRLELIKTEAELLGVRGDLAHASCHRALHVVNLGGKDVYGGQKVMDCDGRETGICQKL